METSAPPSLRKQSAQVFARISSVPVARLDRTGSGVLVPSTVPDVGDLGASGAIPEPDRASSAVRVPERDLGSDASATGTAEAAGFADVPREPFVAMSAAICVGGSACEDERLFHRILLVCVDIG